MKQTSAHLFKLLLPIPHHEALSHTRRKLLSTQFCIRYASVAVIDRGESVRHTSHPESNPPPRNSPYEQQKIYFHVL